MCQCSIDDAQELYFCGFWFFEGERGQMCTNVECLMHILKCKCYVFIDFVFLKANRRLNVMMLNVSYIF